MLFSTQPVQNKLNLICFPYAGGNSNFYTRWGRHLGPDIMIHPVHLPGRGSHIKKPSLSDMDYLVNIIIKEMSLFNGARLALVGTSMGGWIAYHLAQKLSRMNNYLMPECLVICSTASPEYRVGLPDLHGADAATALSRIKSFNPACMKTLQHPELASLFLPILQADFKLCREWKFEEIPRINCPILAFHGKQDSLVADHMMFRWKELTDYSFNFTQITGDHFFSEAPPADFFTVLKNQLDNVCALNQPVC
ncbi:medium-chain acyl-[acyl-carrier-protein] hydrolase [Pseudomonas frederiksbergensis]|uniref:thioesterase II family protein n=1 Tax=Pseudomonas frederiksbergensis TaxID=104087 RepID=UPI003D258A4D